MFGLPFDGPGSFYRGNIHTHSTNSDGALSPDEVIQRYRDEGYDFIALTDHFTERFGFQISDTREYRTDTFTTLIGAELHAPALQNGQQWHVVAAGLPLDFAPTGDHETGQQLVKRAAEAGAFLGIAHPAWYGVRVADAESLPEAQAVEIFNTGHTSDSDRGNGWFLADLLALDGRRILGFAADDAHFRNRPDHFGGWVMVQAESLTPDALLGSLKDGHYYSTQGPTFDYVGIDGDQIVVRCSPVKSIHAAGRPPLNRFAHAEPGELLTEAAFPVSHFDGYFCRITIVDEHGMRGWTNPFWLDGYGPGFTE